MWCFEMDEMVVEAVTAKPVAGFPYPNRVTRSLLRAPIWLYRAGLGSLLNVMHIMVLTTRGRKSDLPRHTAIEYRAHGRKVYVVSIWGGQPDWFQNLLINPLVSLRLGARQLSAEAQIVTEAGEALRVLNLFRKTAPVVYDAVLTRLSTEQSVSLQNLPEISSQFTIVRFEPIPGRLVLPTVQADWRWVWSLILVFAVVTMLMVRRAKT
jgi:deazaflavin-dependent oxidoreductase (nitroreductase family)